MRTYTTKHPRFDSIIDKFNGRRDRLAHKYLGRGRIERYELVGRSVLHLVSGEPVVIVVHDTKKDAHLFMDSKRP